jgi:peptide/nickel transport system ATP-binding protein
VLTAVPILALDGVAKRFTAGRGADARTVLAVDGVSLEVRPGETLGLVGESGSGKSTAGRIALGVTAPDAGRVLFEGADIAADRAARARMRRRVSMVFQDPYSSLDPRMRIGTSLAEPLRIHRLWDASGEAKVQAALDRVGLPADTARRFPHEFSGGQRQRIAIARALMLDPALVVCDEPVSALDASVQAQVLNLLLDLRTTLNLAYLFISHDLGVVRHVSDRVAVMKDGRIVEHGPAAQVCEHPAHEYTRTLFGSIPGRSRGAPA